MLGVPHPSLQRSMLLRVMAAFRPKRVLIFLKRTCDVSPWENFLRAKNFKVAVLHRDVRE